MRQNQRLLAGAEFEGQVERAESDDAGRQENDCQHEQDDAQRAGNNSTKIQVGKQGGDDDADDAVGSSHVLFHNFSPVW